MSAPIRTQSGLLQRALDVVRFSTLSVVMAVLSVGDATLSVAQAQSTIGSDLPGFNSAGQPPRLLVIVDTSGSMRFDPGYTAAYSDDWDPNHPSNPCRNKICIAKKAMYNALSSNASLVEMGGGTYFQTNVTVHHASYAGGGSCNYDILAAPGTSMTSVSNANKLVYAVGTDPTPGMPTDGGQFTCAVESLPSPSSGTVPACNAVDGGHKCSRTFTTKSYTTLYSNANCPTTSPTPAGAPGCTPPNPGTSIYTSTGAGWDTSNYYDTGSPPCSATPIALTGTITGCSASNPCEFFRDTTLDGGVLNSTSTSTSPAVYYPVPGPPYTVSVTNYQNANSATTSAVTITSSLGATCPTSQNYTGTSFLSGSGVNCSTAVGGKCALTGGSGTTSVASTGSSTSSTGFNTGVTVSGYALVGSTGSTTYSYNVSPPATPCDQAEGANFTLSASTYHGVSVGCGSVNTAFPGTCAMVENADAVNNDLGVRTCSFTRTSYKYTKPGATTYSCAYTLSKYTYYTTTPTATCQYRRFKYPYNAPQYTYNWYANGGEILGWTSLAETGNICTDPHTTTGFTSTHNCPDLITSSTTGAPAACISGGAESCKLHWDSLTSGAPSANGRFSNSTGSVSAPFQTFCPAVDSAAAMSNATPTTSSFVTDWCATTSAPVAAFDEPTQRVADLWTGDSTVPGVVVSNAEGMTCTNGLPGINQVWTNTPCNFSPVNYLPVCAESAPPYSNSPCQAPICVGSPPYATGCDNAPTYSPALDSNKDQAMSTFVNASPAANESAISESFVPVGPNTALAPNGTLLKLMSAYDAGTNATGLRIPDYGEITPLYGVLTKAREYYQKIIDADVNAGCRKYYVLLVTDGDENPWLPWGPLLSDTTNGPVAMLRKMTKSDGTPVDVQTFVVGFGVQSDTLDSMAQQGGHPVDASGVFSPTGGALNATDETSLSIQLGAVLGVITQHTYTRSKPVLTNDGKRLYSGYFVKDSDGYNLEGHLDAWALDGGSIGSTPVWTFDSQLNSAPINSRVLYTPAGPAFNGYSSSFVDFVTSANGSPCSMVNRIVNGTGSSSCTAADRTTADTIVNFVRNDVAMPPSASVVFTNGIDKKSRLADIDHSVPTVIAGPAYQANWGLTANEQASYAVFKNTYNTRQPYVFTQSNDGVIHAIIESYATPMSSAAGTEGWGFVPKALLHSLSTSMTGYDWLADGSFGAVDVQKGACLAADLHDCSWRTYLVGFGRGGPTVFGVDITDPTSANYPEWLWEYSDNSNMDWSISPPVAGRVKTSAGYNWAAFVGGGFSTTANKGNYFSILDLLTGTLMTDGVTSAKWSVPSVNNPSVKNNVPSRVQVFQENPPLSSTVYFGDTDGKVNRMNLMSNAIVNWGPQTFFNPYASSTCTAVTLQNPPTCTSTTCTTTNANALPNATPTSAAPIYNRPYIALDTRAVGANLPILYFGTGDSLNPDDPTAQNYFYAVRDNQLNASGTLSCPGQALWGYKFAAGQKILSEPVAVGNDIVVAVYAPATSGACGAGGNSTLYCFNRFTGVPDFCIIPPASVDPTQAPRATLTLGTPGIVSDLSALSGSKSIIYDTSSVPNSPSSVGFKQNQVSFKVKSWKRTR